MDPIATARYGLMAASQRFETSATQIADMRSDQAAEPKNDVAGAVVDMVQAKHAYAANLTVIRFAQDMWDSLLELQTGRK